MQNARTAETKIAIKVVDFAKAPPVGSSSFEVVEMSDSITVAIENESTHAVAIPSVPLVFSTTHSINSNGEFSSAAFMHAIVALFTSVKFLTNGMATSTHSSKTVPCGVKVKIEPMKTDRLPTSPSVAFFPLNLSGLCNSFTSSSSTELMPTFTFVSFALKLFGLKVTLTLLLPQLGNL